MEANDTPEPGILAGVGLSGTSPLRWVFVIVPLFVLAIASANLLGLWTTSTQEAAREARLRQAERRAQDDERADKPLPDDNAWPWLDAPSGAGETSADDAPALTEAGFDATVVMALLAKADPEEGAAAFRFCLPCHGSEKVAPARVGPNLWGVLGRLVAAHPEFRYSAALKAKGGTWATKTWRHTFMIRGHSRQARAWRSGVSRTRCASPTCRVPADAVGRSGAVAEVRGG